MQAMSIFPALVALVVTTSPGVGAALIDVHEQVSEQLTVEHAQVVLASEGGVPAGYLTIWNGTQRSANLIAVQSTAFGSISLRRTENVGDVTRTAPSEGVLSIPGHSELLMKPGGIHLMLGNPIAVLKPGNSISLVLTFDDGVQIETTAELLGSGMRIIDHHHAEGDMIGEE